VRRAGLTWFQLRFPRDLEPNAALAALAAFSGVPHRTRLALDLSATSTGITHRLGITPATMADSITAALRAAMPSLRMEPIEPPPASAGPRLLWQLSPYVATLRSDDLPAVSANLLSALFPLGKHETIRLTWHLRPAVRPVPPVEPKQSSNGRPRALRAKLGGAGLAAHGELRVSAAEPARRGHLMQRIASVLRSLSTPHGRLVAEPYWLGLLARLIGRRGRYLSASELAAVIGWPIGGPDLPGLELGAAKRLVPSAGLPRVGRVLGVSDFAGVSRPVAISPKASTKGLYLLGPTGTGKTSLLKNLVRDDLEQGRGLIVIETNGDLINELADTIPPERINDVVLLDTTDQTHAVGFNPFAGSASPALIADQIGELFQRLWSAYWGPRTAQLAHMGLLTLAHHGGSSLLDLPRLYRDPVFRGQVLADLDDPLGLGPDWQWFEALSSAEQMNVIAPLMNKARAFTARPAVRAIIGQAKPRLTLRQVIAQKKVLLVHLPKGLIGAETAQLLGCLILTATWQAMAERAALPPERRHPFALYVDEVQDFASAPIPWEEMFAQGRKYSLALTVAHQNLGQLPRDLREIVLANARSKAVFTLSAADARSMERLFAPALSAADLQALDAYAIAAQVALDDGSTSRPVTLTTPPPVEPLDSAEEVKARSRERYARPKAEIEADLLATVGSPQRQDDTPIGRKRRSPA
jgi:hypothetical protein